MHEQFIGTMPVQDRHRFDVERLEAYLAANVAGFAGPLHVEQFRGGQSNPTFLLVTPADYASASISASHGTSRTR